MQSECHCITVVLNGERNGGPRDDLYLCRTRPFPLMAFGREAARIHNVFQLFCYYHYFRNNFRCFTMD